MVFVHLGHVEPKSTYVVRRVLIKVELRLYAHCPRSTSFDSHDTGSRNERLWPHTHRRSLGGSCAAAAVVRSVCASGGTNERRLRRLGWEWMGDTELARCRFCRVNVSRWAITERIA